VTLADKHGYVFLLQNWWSTMEYVEVSAQYLAKSKANIEFVMEPLTEIPRGLPTIDACATEAEDNGEDKSMPEY